MRPAIAASLFVALLPSTAQSDTVLGRLGQPDKVGHYAGGATIVATSSVFIRGQYAPEYGLALTAVVAAGKELYDKRHPEKHTADKYDAAATILGGVVVYAALKTENWRVSSSRLTPVTVQYGRQW